MGLQRTVSFASPRGIDSNAILGERPEMKGLYLANGFSGYGFQQYHAAGHYIAELMLGSPPSSI